MLDRFYLCQRHERAASRRGVEMQALWGNRASGQDKSPAETSLQHGEAAGGHLQRTPVIEAVPVGPRTPPAVFFRWHL